MIFKSCLKITNRGEHERHGVTRNFYAELFLLSVKFRILRGKILLPAHSCSFVFLILVFFTVLSGCSGLEKFEKRDLVIEGRGGNVTVKAEIARTSAQHSQGLMYRKEMKDDHGMLFIFERDDNISFWMKNTLIPLSIAFISSDGRILDIRDMEPGNLNPVQPGRSFRYALEMNRGWFERTGIATGDKLKLQF